MAATRIDFNSDLGESFGAWTLGDDAALLPLISSANVACGFHAGDFVVMDRTVAVCKQAGVAVGAQPGYPDLQGFGRRPMQMLPNEVEQCVLYQVGALYAFCRAHGVELQHVKPHGALYNQAATDPALAQAIARAVARFSRALPLVALASSAVYAEAAADAGLRFVPEAFADRAYNPDGTLRSRSLPGAVLHDPAEAAAQALRIVQRQCVVARDGTQVPLHAQSLCFHGDTPGAVSIATATRRAVEAAGVQVRALDT